MKKTDAVTLFLFFILAICVVALIVFWYIGKLDYERSAAPEIGKEIIKFVKINYWVVYVLIGISVLAVIIFVASRIFFRKRRDKINKSVMEDMEFRVFNSN